MGVLTVADTGPLHFFLQLLVAERVHCLNPPSPPPPPPHHHHHHLQQKTVGRRKKTEIKE